MEKRVYQGYIVRDRVGRVGEGDSRYRTACPEGHQGQNIACRYK